MPDFAVLFPAGGLSVRYGAVKLLQPLGGMSVLQRSLHAFAQRHDVQCLVIAASPAVKPCLPSLPRLIVCDGGDCRAQSVLNALRCVPDSIDWIAVHDAARPLVSQPLIDQTFAAALLRGAAAPATPVVQTLRRADAKLPAQAAQIVNRDGLFAMQTPQVMRRADLLAAYANCPVPLNQLTDDLQLLELAGHQVWLTPGEERNLKITTPADLAVAEILLR